MPVPQNVCKQILGENRKRKSGALEGDAVGGLWGGEGRGGEGALKFDQEMEVSVKGVYFCFALETGLGIDFRVGKGV